MILWGKKNKLETEIWNTTPCGTEICPELTINQIEGVVRDAKVKLALSSHWDQCKLGI